MARFGTLGKTVFLTFLKPDPNSVGDVSHQRHELLNRQSYRMQNVSISTIYIVENEEVVAQKAGVLCDGFVFPAF